MKKIFIVSLIGLFLITGCGAGATDTLSCSYENNVNNISTKTVYNIDYEGKEVKKVRVTYRYTANDVTDTTDENNHLDGVGTGTDGTTNDNQPDNDGIVDGVVGSAIDSVINGVTDAILDISGIRERHNVVQSTYGSIPGFSVQNTTDTDENNYMVTYVIDYDKMSDADITNLNLSRDIDTIRSNYSNQGFSCK